MPNSAFPLGQRMALPGNFAEPVILEAVRPVGSGFECRVRLPEGAPDDAVLSVEAWHGLSGSAPDTQAKVAPVDAERVIRASTQIEAAAAITGNPPNDWWLLSADESARRSIRAVWGDHLASGRRSAGLFPA